MALTLSCVASTGWAQQEPTVGPPSSIDAAAPARATPASASDPLRPTGMVLTGAGVVLAGIGALVVAGSSEGEQICGLTGCATQPDFAQRNTGAGLLGAGIGLVWVGGIAWVAGSLDRVPARRRSAPLMTAGIALTGVGAAASVGAVGVGWANHKELQGATAAAVALGIGGGISAMIGVPSWMSGAQTPVSKNEQTERRSPRAAAGGIGLATTGVGALMAASVVGATLDHRDTDVSRAAGVSLAGHGVALLTAGLLLWDHATTPVGRGEIPRAARQPRSPEVGIGPLSTVRWRF